MRSARASSRSTALSARLSVSSRATSSACSKVQLLQLPD